MGGIGLVMRCGGFGEMDRFGEMILRGCFGVRVEGVKAFRRILGL